MDLSNYSKVIYVDQINGLDTNNGLTPQTAVASLTTAKTKITSDNTCVYVKKGTYVLNYLTDIFVTNYSVDWVVADEDRGVTYIILPNVTTVSVSYTKLQRFIGFSFVSTSTSYLFGVTNSSSYTLNFEFVNCGFSVVNNISYLVYYGTSNPVTALNFINCSFDANITNPWTGTAPYGGNFVNCIFKSNYTTQPYNLNNVIFQNYYEPYNVTWQNVGQGTNPDGTTAHLGVYGGTYAWPQIYTPPQNIKNNIEEMEIGDAIECAYISSSSSNNTLGLFGFNDTTNFYSNKLSCISNPYPVGKFYFIKVSKDLLVADRNIQTSISFDTLRGVYKYPIYSNMNINSAKFNSGKQIVIPNSDIGIDGNTQKVTVSFYWDFKSTSVMPAAFYNYDLYNNSGYFGFNTNNSDNYGVNTPGPSHIIAVFNKGDYTLNKIYVNGVKQTLTQKLGSQSKINANFGSNLYISGWGYNTGYKLNGDTLSTIKLWNREITDSEAISIYQNFNNNTLLDASLSDIKLDLKFTATSAINLVNNKTYANNSIYTLTVALTNISNYSVDLLDGGYYFGDEGVYVNNDSLSGKFNYKTALPKNNDWDLIINNPNIDKKYFNTHFYSWCNNIQPYKNIKYYYNNTNTNIANTNYYMLCRGGEDYILNIDSQISSGMRYEASSKISALIGFRPCIRLNRGDIS